MKKKELFCVKCDEPRKTELKLTTIIHNIKDEKIPVEIEVPYCTICGSQLSDLDIEEQHFNIALDEYRKRKNLLFPSEIKKIREKYGISQRAFARALGFAEPTINRYEQGAIQDVVHNNMILLVDQPENMYKIAMQNRNNLSEKELEIISQRIQLMRQAPCNSVIQMDELRSILQEELLNVIQSVNKSTSKIDEVNIKLSYFLKEYKIHLKQNNNSWPELKKEGGFLSFLGNNEDLLYSMPLTNN